MASPASPRKRSPLLRLALFILVPLILLLVIAVALAPTIASKLAPGIIASAASESLDGSASVAKVRLSWSGPQTIEALSVKDSTGREVLRADLKASTSLLSLVRGSRTIGDVRLSGSALVIRDKNGDINLAKLMKPGTPPPPGHPGSGSGSSGPAKLPRTLAAHVVIDSLSVTYADESRSGTPGGALGLWALKGDANFAVGKPLTATLSGDFVHGPDAASATKDGGTLSVAATLDNLTQPDGTLTIADASGDLTIALNALNTQGLDALLDQRGNLTSALGKSVSLNIKANGSASSGSATLAAVSDALTADIALALKDNTLTLPRPGIINAKAGKLITLAPDLAAQFTSEKTMIVETWPDLTATLGTLSLKIPKGAQPLDLRGAAVALTVATTETTGRVAIPGAGGTTTTRPFTLAPLNLTLDAPDLAQTLTLKGGSTATIDGKPAGSFAIDTAVSGILDANGAPVSGLPATIASTIDIKDFATAIAEPLVANAKINLAEDIGPTLNARIVANSTATPGQKLPTADATLAIDSANIKSSGAVRLADNVLTTGPDGLTLSILSAGPIAERFLTTAGLDVASGAAVECSIKDLRADLSKLAPAPTASGTKPTPDLRALAALITVNLGQTQGSMKLPNEPERTPFTLQPTTLVLDATNLASAVKLNADGSAFMAGSPAGTLKAALSASILDANGAPITGIPANLNGTFALNNASTKALQPLASASGLVLAEDIGETLNIEGWAKPSTTAGHTDVSFSANAQKLQVAGQLDLSPTEFKTREQGVKVTAQQVGRILARFAPADQATFEPSGSLQLLAQNISIPLDDKTGKPRFDKSAAQVSLSGSDLRATLIAPDGATQPFNLGTSRVALTLVPGGKPNIDLDSQMNIGSKPSVAKGSIKLSNLFNPDGSINAMAARPEGTIDLADVPTVLASLGGKNIADLVTEALGPTVSAQLAATPDAANTSIRATINASSGTTLAATATLSPTEISVGALTANAAITPQLLATLAKNNPSVPALRAPAMFEIKVDPFALPLKGAALDPTRLAGRRLKTTITGNAAFADITVGQGADMMHTGPVKLTSVRIIADAPLAALGPAASSAAPERATFVINAPLSTTADEPLGALIAEGDIGLSGTRPAGKLTANARLENFSSVFVDRFLKQPGMVSGALGDRFQAAASVNLPEFPTGDELKNLGLNVRMSSERVAFSDVATVRLKPDRLELAKPITIDWKPSPAWATRYMLGQKPDPAAPDAPPQIKFTQGPPIKITLSALTLANGKDATGAVVGPLKPGIFNLDCSLDVPSTSLVMADGRTIALRDLSANLARNPTDPAAMNFRLKTLPIGGGTEGSQPVTFDGTITSITDATGNPTPDVAALTAKGRIAGLPTVLVDSIADQHGMLVELLGPVVNMDLDTQALSKEAGRLSAVLNSERARATVKGEVRNKLFIGDASTGAQVHIISPTLGAKLTEGLPLVGSVEKQASDAPATLSTARLEVPTSTDSPEDLRRLNGDFTLDLGEVRFQTGGAFQSVLKAVGQRDQGTAGRRLKPLHITITDGVVGYDRFALPLGEFNVDTEGTYDLVTKKVDFLTWIPAGALADEATGVFNTGLGGLLGGAVNPIEKLTMLPWRTRGIAGGKLDTKPDLELFIQTTGKNLIREPGKLIEGGLQEIFKNLPGGKGGG